jgi:uncharacterized membrane protein YkvA (DUF1232 family)
VSLIEKLKQRARGLRSETYALYFAARHPKTPRYAKLFVACVVAYAFSPLDLIPDFVPILGYLDDLILLPLGIAFAMRMIPDSVLAECRIKAHQLVSAGKPVSRASGIVIILMWAAAAALCVIWTYQVFK